MRDFTPVDGAQLETVCQQIGMHTYISTEGVDIVVNVSTFRDGDNLNEHVQVRSSFPSFLN